MTLHLIYFMIMNRLVANIHFMLIYIFMECRRIIINDCRNQLLRRIMPILCHDCTPYILDFREYVIDIFNS